MPLMSTSGESSSEEKNAGPPVKKEETRLSGEESSVGDQPPGEHISRTEPKDAEALPQSAGNTAEPAAAEQQKVEALAPLLKTAFQERLAFDIYWAGIYVGSAVLDAVSSEDEVTITSRVRSAPVISAFYKVEDFSESRIVGGVPAHFKIKQREGKYRSDKETLFDFASKKITFLNHLKGTRDEHTVAEPPIWDVISGFYYLRTQTLEIGKPVYIDVFDSNKFIKVEVKVLAKEQAELPGGGDVETIKVQPVLTTDGLFKKSGDIFIWLTNDERKIPVRVETKVPIGTVTAKLKSLDAGHANE